jgi:hypothetical protein
MFGTRIRRAVTAISLMTVLSFPMATHANNFGSEGAAASLWDPAYNGVWLSPTSSWHVGRISMTTTYSNGVYDAVGTQFGPTDLAVGVFSSSTCQASYEVCVYDADYGNNGVNGWNQCPGTVVGQNPNRTCSQQRVQINLFYSPPAQRIACHELAHSVGLRHTGEQASCVKKTSEGGNSQVLSTHDKNHLNDQY